MAISAPEIVKACADWAPICWVEQRPGLAAWLQFLCATAAIIATTVPFIWSTLKEARDQKAMMANALVSATNAFQAAVGTLGHLLTPDGLNEVRSSEPQLFLLENGLSEMDRTPVYSVHQADFLAQYQLIRMTIVAIIAGMPDLVAALRSAEPSERIVHACRWRLTTMEDALAAMAKLAKRPMPTADEVAEYVEAGRS